MSDKSITELLVEYMVRKDGGEPDVLERICSSHPEQADALRGRVELMDGLMHQLDSLARSRVPRYLGDYRILEELGRGGMGRVFVAEDQRTGRKVALKVLPYQYLASDSARQRFQREASAIARLEHPGIVPFYGIGEAEGVPFFAMELQKGITLSRALRRLRGRDVASLSGSDLRGALQADDRSAETRGAMAEDDLSPQAGDDDPVLDGSYVEIVCRLVAQVADALQHAHDQGVTHRDVKPSNIWVGRGGRTKLFDFGLAQISAASTLTVSGVFAGTLSYASPEQVRGRRAEIDHRTDIYSLGVTLYELLTLSLPFSCDTTEEVYRKILLTEPRGVRRINAAVPRELATVCRKAMAKEPAWRYQSAREMASDLERILEHRPIRARAPGAARRTARWIRLNPLPAGIGAVAAAALLTTALLLLRAGGLPVAKALEVPIGTLTCRWMASGQEIGRGLEGELEWNGVSSVGLPQGAPDVSLVVRLRLDAPGIRLDLERSRLQVRELGKAASIQVDGGAGIAPRSDRQHDDTYYFDLSAGGPASAGGVLGGEGDKELFLRLYDEEGRAVQLMEGDAAVEPWRLYFDRVAPELVADEPLLLPHGADGAGLYLEEAGESGPRYRVAGLALTAEVILDEARADRIEIRVGGEERQQIDCKEITRTRREERLWLSVPLEDRLARIAENQATRVELVALNGSGLSSDPVGFEIYVDRERPRLGAGRIRPAYGDRQAVALRIPSSPQDGAGPIEIDGGPWLSGKPLTALFEVVEPATCRVLDASDYAVVDLPRGPRTSFKVPLDLGRVSPPFRIVLTDRVGLESRYRLGLEGIDGDLHLVLASPHRLPGRTGDDESVYGVRRVNPSADSASGEGRAILLPIEVGRPFDPGRSRASLTVKGQTYGELEVRRSEADDARGEVIIPAALLSHGERGLLHVVITDLFGESVKAPFLLECDDEPPEIVDVHMPGERVGGDDLWRVGGAEEDRSIAVEIRETNGLDVGRSARRLFALDDSGGERLLEGLVLPRQEGRYRLAVDAFDLVGNHAALSRLFVVDLSPPRITGVESPELDQRDEVHVGDVVRLMVTARDASGLAGAVLADGVRSRLIRQEVDGSERITIWLEMSAADSEIALCVLDGAGNPSEPYRYPLSVRVTGAPRLLSRVGAGDASRDVEMALVRRPGVEGGIYVDVTEVTVDQFRCFIDQAGVDGGYDFSNTDLWAGSGADPSWRTFRLTRRRVPVDWKSQLAHPRHPVTGICYWEALAFAHWAGKELPGAALWEYAARGGVTESVYPTGNTPPDRDQVWFDHRGDGPRDVGLGPANRIGLRDMGGNVSEWVAGLPTGERAAGEGLVCGGSFWHQDPSMVACGFRRARGRSQAGAHIGFRCACPADRLPGGWRPIDRAAGEDLPRDRSAGQEGM